MFEKIKELFHRLFQKDNELVTLHEHKDELVDKFQDKVEISKQHNLNGKL